MSMEKLCPLSINKKLCTKIIEKHSDRIQLMAYKSRKTF